LPETYQIGPLTLDAGTGVITRAGTPVALGRRAVAVLTVLVRSAPEYVSKTSIIEAAWPGLVVEEGNLAVQVYSIRRVLALVAGGENWLETLSGRGYRFIGPVARPAQASAAATVRAGSRSNLPRPLTSFVGRERELADLQAALARSRLLTLTGSGGVGKTRLAINVAGAVLNRFADGVRLVELAALRDPDFVVQTVVAAVELKEQPGKPLTQTLTEGLHERHLLLLLDNAEQLLDPCAQLTETILRQCPNVTVLVTTRERLGVPGELTYRVPSLAVPDPDAEVTWQRVASYESVRLFIERAQLHRPQFTLSDQNAPALANICRRLDGIPLAIELAAARVRSMSLEEIAQRLDQRFVLLTGGARTLPPRQRTLRAVIDWSFDLLNESESALFCALSSFAGGFTLDAVERVYAGDEMGTPGVLDLLTALVDKNLVLAEGRAATTRYRLLETMHDYAGEQLRARGTQARWHERHFAHFFAIAQEAETQLTGKEQQIWLERLETEHDNVRAALTRSTATGGDVESGLRMATAVGRFWLVRGYLAEGRAWLGKLLSAAPEADKAVRAKALNWCGVFAWKQGDYPAAAGFYEKSLPIRRELNDRGGVGAVLNNQGLLAYEQGDYRAARTLHEESLAIDRELGDRWGVAVSLIHLGSLAMMQGDYPAARAMYEESLAMFRELGDRGHVANALRSLGNLCNEEDDQARARALHRESLAICRELGDRSGIARALYGLGVTARQEGNRSDARRLLEESLTIYRELGDREGTGSALNQLGHLAMTAGDHVSAQELHDESLAIRCELRERSGIAVSIEGIAALASLLGEHDRAALLWGAMEQLREHIGAPMGPSERDQRDRLVAAARTALADASRFDRAWRKGRAMTLEEAIAHALQHARPAIDTRRTYAST
jgi:non-specific serine/threonine protein kinase